MQFIIKNTQKKLPVIFHNLEGYDGHFIFREPDNFINTNIGVSPNLQKNT